MKIGYDIDPYLVPPTPSLPPSLPLSLSLSLSLLPPIGQSDAETIDSAQ